MFGFISAFVTWFNGINSATCAINRSHTDDSKTDDLNTKLFFLINRKALRVSWNLLHCSHCMGSITGTVTCPRLYVLAAEAELRAFLSPLPATRFIACPANLRTRVSQHKSFCPASKGFRKKKKEVVFLRTS